MGPVQQPSRLTATPRHSLPPSAPACKLGVIAVSDIVTQITGGIEFGLTEAVAEPGEAIAVIADIPVVRPQFSQRLEIVQCASRPQCGDAAADGMVLVS